MKNWPWGLAVCVSGFAGLAYEVLWTRYLGLFVGHSAYAQVLVLSVYMGGFALGSAVVARRAAQITRPWRTYALVEASLALFGFVFPTLYVVATNFGYDVLFPALGSPSQVSGVRWGMAGLLILPQSTLLGATFPLMASGVLRTAPRRPTRAVGTVYGLNALGGAVGVLVTGFLLVGWLGLPGTSYVAGALNATIALGVYMLDRQVDRERPGASLRDEQARTEVHPGDPAPTAERDAEIVRPVPAFRGLILVSLLTAVATFAYEIGWIRMLSLVLGSATHAFELMLSAIVLGLAIGAWITARWANGQTSPVRLLGVVQVVMGIAAALSIPVYLETFGLTAALMQSLADHPSGYLLYNVARYGICLLVMLPAAICAGSTVPLITGALLRAGVGERSIGQVYGANTVGSVLGVAVSGLIALPYLGLKGLVLVGAGLDALLGVCLLVGLPGLTKRYRSVGIVACLAALPVFGGVYWGTQLSPVLLASGVFRTGTLPDADQHLGLYYADGRTATVSAHAGRSDGVIVLATNGKPDASLGPRWRVEGRDTMDFGPIPEGRDITTQILGPMVGLAHHPTARTVANVGHGSGMSAAALLTSDQLERLLTIEIEPFMIEGSLVFMPANARAFEDPRSSFIFDDAKSVLAYSGESFDLIFTEPSNPWVSGTSSLFTTEFYQTVARALDADGAFVQWIQLYELTDDLFLSVLAAMDSVFGSYRGYLVGDSDVVIVASLGEELREPDWSVLGSPGFAQLNAGTPTFTPTALDALLMFDSSLMRPLVEGIRPNSDFRPILDVGAERARFDRSYARGIRDLATSPFDWVRSVRGVVLSGREYEPVSARGLEPAVLRARADWLREALESGGGIAPEEFPEWQTELVHLGTFLATLESGETPVSWMAWSADFVRADAALHWGTSGWSEPTFRRRVGDYINAVEPPDEAAAVVALIEAFRGYRWDDAADAASLLVAPLVGGEPWLGPGELLELALISYLHAGRAGEARDAIRTLAPLTNWAPTELRLRVATALLAEASSPPP